VTRCSVKRVEPACGVTLRKRRKLFVMGRPFLISRRASAGVQNWPKEFALELRRQSIGGPHEAQFAPSERALLWVVAKRKPREGGASKRSLLALRQRSVSGQYAATRPARWRRPRPSRHVSWRVQSAGVSRLRWRPCRYVSRRAGPPLSRVTRGRPRPGRGGLRRVWSASTSCRWSP